DCNHVIAVASTDASDAKSSFSTYGTWVHVAAPGGSDQLGNGIVSTSYVGTYVYAQGTSMAAPVVSGLAALVWSTPAGTSAASVVQRIESTADPIAGTGTFWVYGRVNLAAAVAPIPTPAPCTPAPTATPVPSGIGHDFSIGLDACASPSPTPA